MDWGFGSEGKGGGLYEVGLEQRLAWSGEGVTDLLIVRSPFVSGWEIVHRKIRPDFVDGLYKGFQAGELESRSRDDVGAQLTQTQARIARMRGEEPAMMPIVHEDPLAPCVLPTPDAYQFFMAWSKKCSGWKNECTVLRFAPSKVRWP